MKPKILITGASGFIGSHLVEEAVRQGFEVYAGIRESSSTIYLKGENIHLLELDLSSREELSKRFSTLNKNMGGFQYVIHNAGITHAKKRKDFQIVNVDYTGNLIQALEDAKVPLRKFVLISSLATHGPGNASTMKPIQGSDAQEPISSYGRSKLLAEKFLKSRVEFPFLILRPTAVYGPRDKDFLQFVKLVRYGLEPYIGTHDQMISMIYVKDLARVVIAMLRADPIRRSYLVSDGQGYNKEQLGGVLKSVFALKTIKLKVPSTILRWTILAVEKIYSLFGTVPFLNTEKLDEIGQANWLCDSSEVWQDLATSPQYNLETGMKETVAWYLENGWLKKK